MRDGQSIAMDAAEQVHLPIEEARLARAQAEEAVQRIQQRIERLACLSEALEGPKGDDARREPGQVRGSPRPPYDGSD
jgi:hypothetical protein